MRRLFLVRHGTPDFGRSDIHFYSRTDYPLGERGRRDADYLGERLDRELGETFAFFSSPLRRSHQTAMPLAARRPEIGEPVLVDDLMEISCGVWEGRSFQELEREYPEALRLRRSDPSLFTPPQGESFADGQARVVAAVEKLLDENDGDVVVVAHAMVNLLFLAHAAKWPLTGLYSRPQPFGCFNELLVEETRGEDGKRRRGYVIRRLGEKPHDAPDEDQMNRIFKRFPLEAAVRNHSLVVNELAMALGRALNERGESINLAVLDAAAKLHDIARGEKKHARAGAALLTMEGYPLVAAAVGDHQDLPESEIERLSASSLLYLADKCCLEEDVVGITERFRVVASWDDGRKSEKLRRREDNARRVLARVRAILAGGPAPEEIAGCRLD